MGRRLASFTAGARKRRCHEATSDPSEGLCVKLQDVGFLGGPMTWPNNVCGAAFNSWYLKVF